MTPLLFTLIMLAVAYLAGLLGSLVGVGGGIIIVPVLTLFFGVDIKNAVAASIVAVVATSSGAASAYVREGITNLRLAMFLEVATALGALLGAFFAGMVAARALYLLFALALLYTSWSMYRPRLQLGAEVPADPWADRLRLHNSYFDQQLGRQVAYRVSRTKLGLTISWLAGLLSGLLGIGGGILKVPVMNLAMGIPIKVCTATSNLMIGVTAATGAAVYFMRGEVLPFIAAPVAIGVLLGAKTGSRLLGHLPAALIRGVFVVVLLATAVQMLLKGAK